MAIECQQTVLRS